MDKIYINFKYTILVTVIGSFLASLLLNSNEPIFAGAFLIIMFTVKWSRDNKKRMGYD